MKMIRKDISKKGFTLIELLAVILILGIIALIAIPTVNNIINESKRGAFKASVTNLVSSLEQKCETERIKNGSITKQYTFSNSGASPKVEMKGTLPISGTASLDDDCNVALNNISNGTYTASKTANSDNIIIDDKKTIDNSFAGVIKKEKLAPSLTLPFAGDASLDDDGLFDETDENGKTYYFRGNVDNNYVEFGTYKQEIYTHDVVGSGPVTKSYYDSAASCETGRANYGTNAGTCSKLRSKEEPMIWRIIRVNGDGTVRMILQDSVAEIVYSDGFDDTYYAGYTYDKAGTKSNIKNYLDTWYSTNIGSISSLDSLVATTSFCNDTSTIDGSYDKYGFYATRINETAQTVNPTFICPTTSEVFGGKNDLKVGLITADEAVFAGLFNRGSNRNQYLWNGDNFWTMTPSGYDGSFTYVFSAGEKIASAFNVDPVSARPVINIVASAKVTGTGKINDMYKISK